jgi:competence protein ComEC
MMLSTLVVGTVSTANAASEAFTAGKTMYIDVSSGWAAENATFKATYFYSNGSGDLEKPISSETLTNVSGYIYKFTIPNNNYVRFIRFDRLSSDGNSTWNSFAVSASNRTSDDVNYIIHNTNKWHDAGQTVDCQDCYTWSTYTATGETHKITYTATTGITWDSSNPTTGAAGSEVTITATGSGNNNASVLVNGTEATMTDANTYKFTMPDEDVTVTATLVEKPYIYIIDATGWSNFYVYMWNGTAENNAWHGVKMTSDYKAEVNDTNGTVYKYYYDFNYSSVIFNDGDNTQTGTLDLVSGNCYLVKSKSDINTDYDLVLKTQYTATYTNDGHGTVTGSSTFYEGDTLSFTATPKSGYELEAITVNGEAITGTTTKAPASNITVNATFKAINYNITYPTGTGYTITNKSATTATKDTTVTFSVTASDSYSIKSVSADTTTVVDNGDGTYKFAMPAKDVKISVDVQALNVDTNYYLSGDFNTWDTSNSAYQFKSTDGGKTASVTYNVTDAESKYEFKIYDLAEKAYYSNSSSQKKSITETNNSCTVSYKGGTGNNLVLTPSKAGTYTFTLDLSTKKLTVSYPKQKYTIYFAKYTPSSSKNCTKHGYVLGLYDDVANQKHDPDSVQVEAGTPIRFALEAEEGYKVVTVSIAQLTSENYTDGVFNRGSDLNAKLTPIANLGNDLMPESDIFVSATFGKNVTLTVGTYSNSTTNTSSYVRNTVGGYITVDGKKVEDAYKVYDIVSRTDHPVTAVANTGYEFVGWFASESEAETGIVSNATTTSASYTAYSDDSNIVFYAVFKLSSYRVRYTHSDDYTVTGITDTTTANYGDTFTFTVTPTNGDKVKVTSPQVSITTSQPVNGTVTCSFTMPNEEVNITIKSATKNTVYLVNTAGWSNPYVYAWDSSTTGTGDTKNNAAWPGESLGTPVTQINGYDVYAFEYNVSDNFDGFVFSDNGSSKTDNLSLTDGQYYSNSSTKIYNNLSEILKLDDTSTGYFLTGKVVGGDTLNYEFKLDEKDDVGTTTVQLSANKSYTFKIYQSSTNLYFSTVETFTSDNNENILVSSSVSTSATIKTEAQGEYKFIFDKTNKTLSVEYPSANTVRVYLKNDANWGTPRAFVWYKDTNNNNAAVNYKEYSDADAMSYDESTKLYYYDFPSQYSNILFYNGSGSGKTDDLTVVAGATYNNSTKKWETSGKSHKVSISYAWYDSNSAPKGVDVTSVATVTCNKETAYAGDTVTLSLTKQNLSAGYVLKQLKFISANSTVVVNSGQVNYDGTTGEIQYDQTKGNYSYSYNMVDEDLQVVVVIDQADYFIKSQEINKWDTDGYEMDDSLDGYYSYYYFSGNVGENGLTDTHRTITATDGNGKTVTLTNPYMEFKLTCGYGWDRHGAVEYDYKEVKNGFNGSNVTLYQYEMVDDGRTVYNIVAMEPCYIVIYYPNTELNPNNDNAIICAYKTEEDLPYGWTYNVKVKAAKNSAGETVGTITASSYTETDEATVPVGTHSDQEKCYVNISATPNYGYVFSNWTTDTENIIIQNSSDESTKIVLKDGYVSSDTSAIVGTVTAHFTKEGSQDVTITYNFNDYVSPDSSTFEWSDNHTLNPQTYTVTLEDVLDSELTGENILAEVQKNAPVIQSNYFDYTLNTSTIKMTYVTVSSGKKKKIVAATATLTETPHTYSVTVRGEGGSKQEYSGYYQQKVDVKASDLGVNDEDALWTQTNYETSEKENVYVGSTYSFRIIADNTTITVSDNNNDVTVDGSTVAINSYYNFKLISGTQYLTQNYYIADYLAGNTAYDDNGTPVDDASDITYLGSGVMYYYTDKLGNYTSIPSSITALTDTKNYIATNLKDKTSDYTTSVTAFGPNSNKDGTVLSYQVYQEGVNQIYSTSINAYLHNYGVLVPNLDKYADYLINLYSFYVYSYKDSNGNTQYQISVSSEAAQANMYMPSTDPSTSTSDETDELTVTFVDVEQGDGIIIQDGDFSVVIDSGKYARNGEAMNKVLKEKGIKDIDIVIATHPDLDHIGGFSTILAEHKFKTFYTPDCKYGTDADSAELSKTYTTLLNSIAATGTVVKEVGDGKEEGYYDGGASKPYDFVNLAKNDWDLLLLAGGRYTGVGSVNKNSIVTKLVHGDNTIMLTGDAEEGTEHDILAQGYDVKSDVLKLGHHGSKTCNTVEFISAVNPTYGVISVGDNNYGLPSPEVTTRFEDTIPNCLLFTTETYGTITIYSDRKHLSLLTEK